MHILHTSSLYSVHTNSNTLTHSSRRPPVYVYANAEQSRPLLSQSAHRSLYLYRIDSVEKWEEKAVRLELGQGDVMGNVYNVI